MESMRPRPDQSPVRGGSNRRIFTVGQINRYIRGLFAGDALLSAVSVRGEVSNCKYHSSGHIYFSIKDTTGTLSCILFAGNRRGLAFRMKDGDKVVVSGTVDVYERDGRYQLYAKEIHQEGEGELHEKFLRLKKSLEAEGLFRMEDKKSIPRYASTIGVVTAPTGAAVRDIQNISRRRNPYVQLLLCPAQVQGEGAAKSIARAIGMLDGLVDVIIVGRGGGSLEDLWAFNEEVVARAIHACGTPVISAVGHETDVTIADFAADLRAPTPSAAAELAVFDMKEYDERCAALINALAKGVRSRIASARSEVKWYGARLDALSPVRRLRDERRLSEDLKEKLYNLLSAKLRAAESESAEYGRRLRPALESKLASARQQSDSLSGRLQRGTEQVLNRRIHAFSVLAARMQNLNPVGRLRQGYSYTAGPDGRAVRSVKAVRSGDLLTIHVTDGRIFAEVRSTEETAE